MYAHRGGTVLFYEEDEKVSRFPVVINLDPQIY
jgi:hypothetical protein